MELFKRRPSTPLSDALAALVEAEHAQKSTSATKRSKAVVSLTAAADSLSAALGYVRPHARRRTQVS